MNLLGDVLRHGVLPFHGRVGEVSAIVQFWRGVLKSDHLRCLLVEGEAGVGKSSLLQEAIRQIEAANGAVVVLKLYSESTAAIAPLVAQALGRDSRLHRLVRGNTLQTLAGCADALRRIARLRPMMLVVEDIHLLAGAALREFAQLVAAIADEPIALCAAARPLDYPARAVLAEKPLQQLRLQGLSSTEIGIIWKSLFGELPAPDTLAVVAAETLGNALAIRAVLQGGVSTGAIQQRHNGVWGTEPTFRQSVRQNSQALINGLAIQLTQEERVVAEQLASLGEVFSGEAATVVASPKVVQSLAFNGVLHQLPTPKRPLPGLGRSAELPWAFTHSLVHREFLSAGRFPVGGVLAMLSGAVPIYSILPFRLLLNPPNGTAERDLLLQSLPLEHVRCATDTALSIAVELDVTADWPFALTVWQVAELLLEANAGRFSTEELRQRRANALARKLTLLRRELDSQQHQQALRGLLELTQEPLPDPLAIFRIIAIAQQSWSHADNPATLRRLLDEALALGGRYPWLRSERLYAICLRDFCQIAIENQEYSAARNIEAEYQRIQEGDHVPEAIRRIALVNIGPYLLMLFDSPQELARRTALCQQIAAAATDFERSVLDSITPYFYWETGELEPMIAVLKATMEGFKAKGMMRTYRNRALLLAKATTVMGGITIEEFVEWIAQHTATCVAEQLLDLANDATAMLELLPVALLLGRGNLISTMISNKPLLGDLQLPTVFSVARGTQRPAISYAEEEFALLGKQIVRLEDVIRFRAAMAVARNWATGSMKHPLPDPLQEDAAAAFRNLLDWLAARRLDALLLLLLRDYAALLPVRQRAAYRKQAAAIATKRNSAAAPKMKHDHRLSVTMLGKIEVRPADPNATAVQPRGARQKAFLGTMVANELMGGRLDRKEFLEAAGIEVDYHNPKLARDAVNSAIYRLRDLVGHDGILTDHETPRLNLELLRVDLIEAEGLLRDAAKALQRAHPARARDAALRALEILRGEVPFPTLYEGVFEQLRDDLENRLRLVVLRTATLALREGDAEGAELLLRRAWGMLPGDDEIGDLYCAALEALDRPADAANVRKKMEAA